MLQQIEGTPKGQGEDGSTAEETLSTTSPMVDTTSTIKAAVFKRDCKDLLNKGNIYDGVYNIYAGGKPVRVWCDMDNGGWTVFQRRIDGSTDFQQDFATYSKGFGNPKKEFWLGLENLHQLTKAGIWEMRIDLESIDEDTAYAHYSDFKIGEGPGYRLQIGTYSGTAGNSMGNHNNQRFSKIDRDQDADDELDCSAHRNGAWWYGRCGWSNLNSFAHGATETRSFRGMFWRHFRGYRTYMKTTTMKLRLL